MLHTNSGAVDTETARRVPWQVLIPTSTLSRKWTGSD